MTYLPAIVVCRMVGAFALGLAMSGGAGARPAAVVTDIEGRATLHRGDKSMPIALLTEIGDSEQVELAPNARLTIVQYWTSQEYALRGPSRVRFGYSGPEGMTGTPPEKRGGESRLRLNPAGLVQAVVQMRSLGGGQVKLLAPIGLQILELVPEFRWEPVAGASEYRFSLSGDKGTSVFEARVAEARVALPSERTLVAGAGYAWRVTAVRPGAPEQSGTGGFTTASTDLAEEVRRYRPAEGAPVSDLVIYALWLRQAKLDAEAERVWRKVREQRPAEPVLKTLIGE